MTRRILLVVDEGEVVELRTFRRFRYAVVDVFDELECVAVAVDECQGVLRRADGQQLFEVKAIHKPNGF